MLTHDNAKQVRPGWNEENGFKEMTEGKLPDTIMIGERNTCWMQVRRSTKVLELVDKINGKITAKIPMDGHFAQVARDRHNLGPRQIGAALGALELK